MPNVPLPPAGGQDTQPPAHATASTSNAHAGRKPMKRSDMVGHAAAGRRPRRSLSRVLAVLVAVMLAPVVAFAVWSRVEARRLDRALDAIEARGEALEVSAWDSEPATAEQQQAARLYLDAAEPLRGVALAKFLP